MITKEQRDALRKAAEAATPGPWTVGGSGNQYTINEVSTNVEANFDFIAAANPVAVLAVLDDIDALTKANNALLSHFDQQIKDEAKRTEHHGPVIYEKTYTIDQVVAMEQENARLRKFWERARDNAFEGCDMDGGEIQEVGLELGLLRSEPYDPIKHGDHEGFEEGDTICVDTLASKEWRE